MSDLTLRGVDIRTRGGIFLDLDRGYSEPPEVRGRDVIVPARAGRVARGRVADRRSIVLTGYVQGTSASDWRLKTDTLMALLDATLDPGDLVVDDEYLGLAGGLTATISVRCVNAIGGPIFNQTFQTWSIELESVDPDWVIE